MSLTPIYSNVGGSLFMAGCPLSEARAKNLFANHATAAKTGATASTRAADESLRDELLLAMARAAAFELAVVTLGLERISAAMRASLSADQRPGADVIPFPARVAVPGQSLESL